MARHDRELARQLSRIEQELGRCEGRARYYSERIAELRAERERLAGRREEERAEEHRPATSSGDPPAGGDQLGGVLGNLIKSLDADTIKALGEAAKGIDMGSLLGAVGGAGGLSGLVSGLGGGGGTGAGGGMAGLLGGLGGGGGSPGGGGLAGLLGGLGGGSGGSVLDGISEVIDFFTKRPGGESWSVKDLPQAVKLLGSPNVRALVGAASKVNSVWKGFQGLQKASAAVNAANLAPSLLATEPAPAPAPATPELASPRVRFSQIGGPNRILDPWVGAAAG